MIKKILSSIPDKDKIKENKHLKIFGKFINDPLIWTTNRKSIIKSVFFGIFIAWLPIPFQMVVAAAMSILIKSNIAVAVCLVWITNPITMPFMLYGAYIVGAAAIGNDPVTLDVFTLDIDLAEKIKIITTFLADKYYTMTIGSIILGIISGSIAALCVNCYWRCSIKRRWRIRQESRK